MNTTSYWLDEPRLELPRGALRGTRRGGRDRRRRHGCSCALTLAERGVRVRLHEAGEIAAGASGRNGGFALRGATASYDRARVDLGAEPARRLMALTERALDRMEQLAGDAFRRVGSLRLAVDEAERDELRREYDALREDGFAVDWVDDLAGAARPALRRRDPPSAGRRAPAGALGAAACRRTPPPPAPTSGEGDRGRASTQARRRRRRGRGRRLHGRAACPSSPTQVRPTRGQVLATEPLAELRYARPHYARAGYDYWQQLPDGRLVIGGNRDASLETEETDVVETTALIQQRLDELVERLVGGRPRVTNRWAGIWGTTPDLMPLVGPVPGRDDVWVAGGYSGHGNALGLACGELVARAILGERPPELELFDPLRLRRP